VVSDNPQAKLSAFPGHDPCGEWSLNLFLWKQERGLDESLRAGKLHSEAGAKTRQGVRVQRAEINRNAMRKNLAEGLTRIRISRKLGVKSTTVDGAWLGVSLDQTLVYVNKCR
jgi:hypothetical protein